MIITILLIISCTALVKSIGKLKDVNWNEVASKIWDYRKSFGLKSGRAVYTPLLTKLLYMALSFISFLRLIFFQCVSGNFVSAYK